MEKNVSTATDAASPGSGEDRQRDMVDAPVARPDAVDAFSSGRASTAHAGPTVESPGTDDCSTGDTVDLDHPISFTGTSVMRARVDRCNGVVTLSLVGEFDLAAIDGFTTVLTDLEATNPRAIAVDVKGLSFIDSSGLRSLLNAHEHAAISSHRFAVLNGSGPAHRVLMMTGLNERLMMIEHTQELLDSLAEDSA